MLERLNQELKRRTHVIRIFPNEESCLRLIRALAVEIHEDWIEAHRYLNMEMLREQRKSSNSWRPPKVNATACSQTGCSGLAPAPELCPCGAPAAATSPFLLKWTKVSHLYKQTFKKNHTGSSFLFVTYMSHR